MNINLNDINWFEIAQEDLTFTDDNYFRMTYWS